MDIIIEVLKMVLAPFMTGFFGFLVAKYTYNRNIPLDKLEVAYNRIYYPLFRIISDKNANMDEVIRKSEIYFTKYDKYADISTKRSYLQLRDCKKVEKEALFQIFRNNIYDRHSFLRRRLGYLEPNFLQQYKYFTSTAKFEIRIVIMSLILYFAVIICVVTINNFVIVYHIFLFVGVLLFVFILLDSAGYFISRLKKIIHYKLKRK